MSLVRCHVKKASEPELSFAKFRVLANINRGIQTVGEIADLHGVSQPAISKLVESLVCEDFLTRHDHISDRRVIELRLTPIGRAKIKYIKSAAGQSFEPYLEMLSEKEKSELNVALECLDSFFIKIQEKKC
jgi:DNA-binding MarR family transcriptional regulator